MFCDFAVGLSFAESARKDLLEFLEIPFDGLPQRSLGDRRFASKSAHSATFETVARNVEIAEDPIQGRTVCSYSLARELAHLIGHFNTQGGKLEDACDKIGVLRSVSYSADYVFLRKE